MTKNKNKVEDDLDAIRIDFYEKTKNMTADERIAYIKTQTEHTYKKFGIRTVKEIVPSNDNCAASQ